MVLWSRQDAWPFHPIALGSTEIPPPLGIKVAEGFFYVLIGFNKANRIQTVVSVNDRISCQSFCLAS